VPKGLSGIYTRAGSCSTQRWRSVTCANVNGIGCSTGSRTKS